MGLYTGFDLHSAARSGVSMRMVRGYGRRNCGTIQYLIVQMLRPFEKDIEGIVVESTYNWYWLVDFLMEEGYRVHLGPNPSRVQQYSGLKHGDDEHDAFWLAEMAEVEGTA